MRLILLPLAMFTFCAIAAAQVSSQSYLRDTPTSIEGADLKTQRVIARAEDHFKRGSMNLLDGKKVAAREEFDLAVDAVLTSGLDVRAVPRLQRYYLELVERIYRLESPAAAVPLARPGSAGFVELAQQGANPKQAGPTVGFVEQKFEPSPLDDFSRILDVEKAAVRRPCQPEKFSAISLRGLRLGMTLAQFKTLFPAARAPAPDAQGSRQITVEKSGLKSEEFKGVEYVVATFLDSRLYSLGIFYDNSVPWKSGTEFSEQVAASLELPSTWEPYGADEMREMSCARWRLAAGLTRIGARRKPLIMWVDMSAINTIVERKEAARERELKRQEQLKQGFKP